MLILYVYGVDIINTQPSKKIHTQNITIRKGYESIQSILFVVQIFMYEPGRQEIKLSLSHVLYCILGESLNEILIVSHTLQRIIFRGIF